MGDARIYLCEGLKIKQDSIFDFGEFYKRLFSWFEIMGYDFSEKGYEKYEMGNADNLKIFWEAEKVGDGYAKFVMEVGFFIVGFGKVEIEKDGLKIKTNKGTLEMRITSYLVRDEGDKIKSSIGEAGRNFYEKFIIKQKLEDYEGQLYEELHMFFDEVKSFLSMHKF